MTHRFSFFDVDSRELDESARTLGYRPRVLPIVPKLERLYSLADTKGWPLVFTTCCSGRMLSPKNLPDVLFIPLDASDTSWCAAVGKHRRFYLAKRTCGDPKLNYDARTFDMFQHNANARRLLQSLDVETWVVFGNGFDLCVNAAANGILNAGLPLILLEAMVRSRPVIATAVGGVAEVIDSGVHGALVPAGDVVALADELERFHRKTERAIRMGRAGGERVRSDYTWQAVVDGFEAVYDDVLGLATFAPVSAAEAGTPGSRR